MSVKVAVRIPDELAARIDAMGKNRSVTIITALESVFGTSGQPEPESPTQSRREKVKKTPAVLKVDRTCPRCQSAAAVVPWGDGLRCVTCKRNFSALLIG